MGRGGCGGRETGSLDACGIDVVSLGSEEMVVRLDGCRWGWVSGLSALRRKPCRCRSVGIARRCWTSWACRALEILEMDGRIMLLIAIDIAASGAGAGCEALNVVDVRLSDAWEV